MKCLQCDSKRIVEKVRAIDIGNDNIRNNLMLEVYEKPDALLFKGAQYAEVFANVCASCGFVMFGVSVDDAQKLEKYKE